MGTDSIQLYNKGLSDQILGMDRRTLTRYLEINIDALKNKEKIGDVSYSDVVVVMNHYKCSVAKAVEKLLSETKLNEFKKHIAFDYCFGDEKIYLDYWGCYAHVFAEGDPEGAIPCNKYLREKECDFLLLRPKHVDRMIKSLQEHSDDLPVMAHMKTGIDRVEYFRDFCLTHPDYWVAYRFDF
jgi:hypothetical protein